MSNRVSGNLLIVEAVIIMLPISALTLLITGGFIMFGQWSILGNILAILSALCLAAICSGWRLFVAYLHGGVDNLRQQHLVWWAVIAIGMLILLAAWISKILPPSPEFSQWGDFRSLFEAFVFASPILIPLIHLVFERFFRKTMQKNSEVISAHSAAIGQG
jgi:hypothetical protein